MKITALTTLLMATTLWVAPIYAEVESAKADIPVTTADLKKDKDIASVERYLTNISTIVSDFVQVAPDGSLSSGKMFIKRPKKMRWVYDPPTPIIMNTRGNFLTYYDFDLKQVSDIPLDSTLLSFFAQTNIKFGETVKVVEFKKDEAVWRIALVQANTPENGKLTMEFTTKPLTLRNFKVKDAQGQETTISLNHARFDVPLDDAVFAFQDPRILKNAPKR